MVYSFSFLETKIQREPLSVFQMFVNITGFCSALLCRILHCSREFFEFDVWGLNHFGERISERYGFLRLLAMPLAMGKGQGYRRVDGRGEGWVGHLLNRSLPIQ